MKKWIIGLLLIITVLSLSSQEILKVKETDSTIQYYDVGDVSNMTFSDYQGYNLRINKFDGSTLTYSLSDISDLTFTLSDLELTPPLNYTVTVSESEANLTWDAVSGTTIYNIYRSTDPYSGFTKIGTSQTLDYQDADVSGSDKYFYFVTAENAKK